MKEGDYCYMMVLRMIVLAGSSLDYNDNARLKSRKGDELRGRSPTENHINS